MRHRTEILSSDFSENFFCCKAFFLTAGKGIESERLIGTPPQFHAANSRDSHAQSLKIRNRRACAFHSEFASVQPSKRTGQRPNCPAKLFEYLAPVFLPVGVEFCLFRGVGSPMPCSWMYRVFGSVCCIERVLSRLMDAEYRVDEYLRFELSKRPELEGKIT